MTNRQKYAMIEMVGNFIELWEIKSIFVQGITKIWKESN